MSHQNQKGSAASLLLIVFLVLALLGSLGFGLWAYAKSQDYKNNVDKKIAAAVEVSKSALNTELQKAFDEQAKSPNKTYQSPATSGSITFSYPKTWSAYVDESSTSQPVNGYFHPNIVPGTQGSSQSKPSYALRVEMLNADYSQTVKSLESKTKEGGLRAAAYIPPKMEGQANVQPGTLLTGLLDEGKNGAMVIIKVRDKTLKVYTESTDYLGDFNNTVLPSLTYLP